MVITEEAEVARQAAHAAVKRPFKVTKLKVKAPAPEIVR